MCSDTRHDQPPSSVPFSQSYGGRLHLDARRFIEAVLVAIITASLTAFASAWATTQVLSDRMARQQSDIQELKRDIRELRRDLYRPSPWQEQAMLLSDLIQALQDSLHDAGEVFDAGDFERHVRKALAAMAEKRPRILYSPLTLEAGQTDYPVPDDLAQVRRIDWTNTASREPWRHEHPGAAPLASLIETSEGRTIRFSPPPTEQQVRALDGGCDLVYLAAHPLQPVGDPVTDHEVTTLADLDQQLLLLRAQAEACKELALRGSTKPVELRAGGQSQPRNMTPRSLFEALLAEWRAAP